MSISSNTDAVLSGAPPWPEEESEFAFAMIGDRFIESWLDFRRSMGRQTLQRQLYTVDGVELTPAQVDALQVLQRRDGWQVQEFAQELGIDQSTATRTLDALVALGLVSRRVDKNDRRAKVVASTARGKRATTLIRDARRGAMRAHLGLMSPARRVMLVELLEEFVATMELVERAESETRTPLPAKAVP
jgi:DNA-binding MarR family transcriptional regulator